MDYMNKSLASSFNTLRHLRPNDWELKSSVKDYSMRDTYQISNKILATNEWDSVFDHLVKSTNLHTLVFSGVNIDSYGLKKLAELLTHNKYVKTFRLEWNYLNEYNEEFDYLCKVFSRSSLVYLHLNNNKIASQQCGSIAKVLRKCDSLLLLDLRWNEIGNEGAREISSALTSNNSVQEVNLSGNKVSQEVNFEISEKVSRNKNFLYNSHFNKEKTKSSEFDQKFGGYDKKDPAQFTKSYLNFFRQKEEEGETFSDKEREMTNEYKARYDSQLLSNANLEKKVKEMEIILNNERSTGQDSQEQLKKDLQNARDLNLNYEDQILKEKEEFLKKEVDWKKKIKQVEDELYAAHEENSKLTNENHQLVEQVAVLKNSEVKKLAMVETQFIKSKESYQKSYEQIKLQNEELRKEYQQLIVSTSEDWERKVKKVEEEKTTLKSKFDSTEKLHSQLKKEYGEYRLGKEIELKETESRIREEESRNVDNLIKKYEAQFRSLELYKEEYANKNTKLINEIEKLKVSFSEDNMALQSTINQLNFDKNNLKKTVGSLEADLGTLRTDNHQLDSFNVRLKKEIENLKAKIGEHGLENTKIISELTAEFKKDRVRWSREKEDLERERQRLKEQLQANEKQIKDIEAAKLSYAEKMKESLAQMIDGSLRDKYNS